MDVTYAYDPCINPGFGPIHFSHLDIPEELHSEEERSAVKYAHSAAEDQVTNPLAEKFSASSALIGKSYWRWEGKSGVSFQLQIPDTDRNDAYARMFL